MRGATDIYPWKRFWCARDGRLNLSHRGFLADPEGNYGKILNSDVVSFEAISHFPCLALLGEPGIGKTTAITTDRQIVEAKVADMGEKVLAVDLGQFSEGAHLIRDVFENDVFREWLSGTFRLHLFLDGLDECRIQVPAVGKLLIGRLEKIRDSLPRLSLRVACRTWDWPAVLDEGLLKLWGKENYGAYELAPLREVDVGQAARDSGIDSEAFIEALCRAEVVPLAIKPLTLKMLLSVHKHEGCFPASKAELYEKGCRALCEEANAGWQDLRQTGRAGKVSVDQRMAIASRIAAVSILCTRAVIVRNPSLEGTQAWEVGESALAGGKEPLGADWFDVDETGIRETIGTGLFTARGSGCMGFAHQTYAEFLAARFLVRRGLETKQIMSLLRHGNDAQGSIVPQLCETAAWTASLHQDVLGEIATNDPQVLLHADADALSDDVRFKLVEKLLCLIDAGEFVDRDWSIRDTFRKLSHSRLADQLRPFILDKTKDDYHRGLVIDIAEACQVDELQSIFVDIALDDEEPVRLRGNATSALEKMSDLATKKRLRSLAFNPFDDDRDDSLKGWALRALWPEAISTEELFACITSPKQVYHHGPYRLFLDCVLSEKLRPEHLSCALKWLACSVEQIQGERTFDRLADAIVTLAWQHLERPDVLAGLGDVCIAKASRCEDLLESPVSREEQKTAFSNPDKRRLLTEYVVRHATDFSSISGGLTWHFPHLVQPADMLWLIERLRSAKEAEARRRWAEVIHHVWGQSVEHTNLIIEEAKSCSDLKTAFIALLEPVELGSERAKKMKAQYDQHRQWEIRLAARRDPPALKPLPNASMVHALDVLEQGDVAKWTDVAHWMSVEDNGVCPGNGYELDIRKLPGWAKADEIIRNRIVNAARRFVVDGEMTTPEIILERQFTRAQFSACQALLLLQSQDPTSLDNMPVAVWTKWIPVLLGISGHRDENASQQELVGRAYASDPQAVISFLLAQIDKDCEQDRGMLLDLSSVTLCWDERLCTVLLQKTRDINTPRQFGQLLSELLTRDCCGAVVVAQQALMRLPSSDENRRIAVQAAWALASSWEHCEWQPIWETILKDDTFGCEFIAELADRRHPELKDVVSQLVEEQAASLYIWIERHFPHREDPPFESGTRDVTSRTEIVRFRSELLNYLENKGTPEALTQVERIVREFPEDKWLSRVRVTASKNVFRNTWRPISPADLMELCKRPGMRLVHTGEQLLEVLRESLARLETRLQGETPSAFRLWDQVDRTRGHERFRPKDENHLSDELKLHLEDDLSRCGIVALREVEIRRGEGVGQGERTDIHVICVVTDARTGEKRQIRAIIEAKGCWHGELRTAMTTQLAGRYMKDTDCRHGLYVVGWYVCPQWDAQHSARKNVPFASIEATQAFLEEQALGLSKDGIVVRSAVVNAALR